MLTKLDSGNVFVNLVEPTDITSASFSSNTFSSFISSFSKDNDYDLSSDMEHSDFITTLMKSFHFDPDGYLAFVSHQYVDSFTSLATQFLLEAEKDGVLNYDNGGVSETFVFTKIDTGMIVEFLDPECFSPFFKEFLLEFHRLFSPPPSDFICIELNHIFTHIQYLANDEIGNILLTILKRNHLTYSESKN